MNEVFAFMVGVKDAPWGSTLVNHRTSGKAKSAYLRDVQESWPDVKFTDLTCRKIGQPETTERFIENAKYRGLPDARCGQRVIVGKALGTIVGHNSSANFNVLFDDDALQYAGLVLNVHPSECRFIEAA